jgi:hypothetical protein
MAYENATPVISEGFGGEGFWGLILIAIILFGFGGFGNGFGSGRNDGNLATNGDLQRSVDTMTLGNKLDTLVNSQGTNFATLMGELKENKYETRLAIQEIQNTIQSCCCSMKQEMTSNTQRIVDMFNAHITDELKEKIAEYSQANQTATIIAALKTSTTTAS